MFPVRVLIRTIAIAVLVLGMAQVPVWAGPVQVRDAEGRTVKLPAPAARIISLAPHITEILYAVGAGDQIVGTVEFSDYPAQANAIPRIGRADALDVEAIVEARPQLVVAWYTGNNRAQVRQLIELGIPVYYSEPKILPDIGTDMRRLGRLAGTADKAVQAAAEFDARYEGLKARYADRQPVNVFYEIWNQPLLTVSRKNLITSVIQLCGGRNVFADLPEIAPRVSEEAVLAADPEVIVASVAREAAAGWLDRWRRWPELKAVRHGNLFSIQPDLMHRQTPRVLQGAQQLCQQLERARAHR